MSTISAWIAPSLSFSFSEMDSGVMGFWASLLVSLLMFPAALDCGCDCVITCLRAR